MPILVYGGLGTSHRLTAGWNLGSIMTGINRFALTHSLCPRTISYERWKPRNGQLAKMRSFHQSKRSDNKRYAVEVRWGFFLRIWRIILFLRAVVNIPIQTLIIPPWLLLRKMIISQLELGPPVIIQAFPWLFSTNSCLKFRNFACFQLSTQFDEKVTERST